MEVVSLHAHIFMCVSRWLLTNNKLWRKGEQKRGEEVGGCIVRESKGGVIRPNGSQMAGCQ